MLSPLQKHGFQIIQYQGYELYYVSRNEGKGGGVALYVNSSLIQLLRATRYEMVVSVEALSQLCLVKPERLRGPSL